MNAARFETKYLYIDIKSDMNNQHAVVQGS